MSVKVGDKVKCIDNVMLEQYFTSGDIYTISKVHLDGIHVNFDHTGTHMWHLDRFELIKEESTMKFNHQVGTNKVVPPKTR